MNHIWQLQEAKNRLSEVVNDAVSDGPQIITRRGLEVAVVVSYAEYERLIRNRTNIVDFFQNSPLAEVEIDLTRDKDPGRLPIEL